MGDKFFAIFSDAVSVKRSGKRLTLIKGDKKISVLLKNLKAILVFGNAHFSGESLNLILSEEVPIFLFTRFGKLKGIIYSETLASNYNNRLEQYELYKNKRLEVAKFFVLKKVGEIENVFQLSLEEYKQKLLEASDLNEVRGIEGIVSKLMFERVKETLTDSPFKFEERSYYPPKDEVNALLSLTYTLIYAMTYPLVVSLGYDPYISFLHSKRGTHMAFCSDVMEVSRPFATYELVEKIKAKVFKKSDFDNNSKGIYLNPEGLNKLLNFVENISDRVLELIRDCLAEFSTFAEDLK